MKKLHSAEMCALFVALSAASGQDLDSLETKPSAQYPPAITFFAPLFFPKVLQDEYRLKEYICSDDFAAFRKRHGDVQAVNQLFNRALRLSWNNVYEALLLSFVCSVEHRNFGVKLPVLGSLLWLPLTSEFPEDFRRRVNSLPSRLYPDTPGIPGGDRDKLQHFFGSAFLTYTFESPGASDRVGMFVEWGEDKFVVEGSFDQRDIRANIEGQHFGARLLSGVPADPSDFMGKGVRHPAGRTGCVLDESQNSLSELLEER